MHGLHPITRESCVVRNTAARTGRTGSVAPGVTAARHLHYGRIILDPNDPPIAVDPGGHETGLVSLKGRATVQVGPKTFEMSPYDALYVPRATAFTVAAAGEGGCDLAELSAPVSRHHPVQFVRFADVQRDPGLHFAAGGPSSRRVVNILLGKNVDAGRLLAGVTFSEPGNWTSWPPHEHGAMLEEAYLYIDMPAPAFGIQLVYADSREPELATLVREGDVVLMPQGFHPNVAAPGNSINFLWMMAAGREDQDRQFGVVNVQPDFAATPSGLDAGRDARK
jgi:5-deoxy-glucuronate isomerase